MRHKLIIYKLSWTLILTVFNAHGQDYFESYQKIVNSKNPSQEEKKIDSIIDLSLLKERSIEFTIKIIHNYSLKLYKRKKYNKGLKYVLWEKELYEKNNIFNKKYISVLFNAGLFYFNNFEYKKALSFYKKVIEKDTFNHKLSNANFELGRVYNKLGSYQGAISYYIKSIRYYKKVKDYNRLMTTYINLFAIYTKLGTDKSAFRALKILQEADSISKEVNVNPGKHLILQRSLATHFTNKFYYTFNKASFHYKNNLKLGFIYKDSGTISGTYNNLAYLYNIEKKDSAEYFIQIGLMHANYSEVKSRLYDNLTDYQIRKNQPQKALKSIHKSLEIITKSEIKNIPSNYQINQSILKDYTLYCLKKKAEIYLRLYHQNEDKKHLKNAIKNIESAEYVVNLLLNGTTEASTQLIWRREASQAYLYGAYAAHLLGDEEQAFSFMEKNKALLLSESIIKNTEFANLPKNVSDEETRLQKLMYELENKLSKNESNVVLQDSLFNAKRHHEKYVDSLKVVYPKYFDRKIDVTQVPLSKVKEELKKDQVLVSYIWNKFDEDTELLIGLATSKEKAITFEINQTDSLKKKIARYRALISQPQNTKEGQEAYQKVAYELYQELFPSQEVKNLIKRKNLIIIPDGDLQNIPFEALITKENSNDYFILNGDVNYSYSYSFLKHNDKVKRETNQSFIGYSPVSFKEGLSSLNDSEKEVETITKELGGVSKFNKQASKEDFLKQSSKSKIIHLATHADAGENPWIAFSDEKLELHELYTYKNNAELVTLSACNTSLGEMAKGEGVLSLARGFFHSGSKSVVSSLWNVNDTSTSDIMTDFYKNLKEGQTKSEALNNAKRTYLITHELSAQSPYYWSSFVLIGDAEAIYESHNYWLYTLVILGFLALFIFFRKKRIS